MDIQTLEAALQMASRVSRVNRETSAGLETASGQGGRGAS